MEEDLIFTDETTPEPGNPGSGESEDPETENTESENHEETPEMPLRGLRGGSDTTNTQEENTMADTVTYKLEWDGLGQKQYEMGVSHGVLYKYDSTAQKWKGVAWNGLISVTESPEGADETELWADNIKYGSLRSAEKFGGSIEAYTYPEEFEGCDGLARPATGMTIGQQKREIFCLSYRTEIGNDQDSEAGYRLHLVYNATCSPSEKSYETINDSPDAITFSWDFDTTPVPVANYKPTSHISFDSTDFSDNSKLIGLEKKLYGEVNGQTTTDAELPLPDAIIAYMTNGSWS